MTTTTRSSLEHRLLVLSGRDLCRLMRRHRVTIRDLARRTGITQKRIREIRRSQLTGLAVHDWIEAITGEFTPRMRAQMNYILANCRGN